MSWRKYDVGHAELSPALRELRHQLLNGDVLLVIAPTVGSTDAPGVGQHVLLAHRNSTERDDALTTAHYSAERIS